MVERYDGGLVQVAHFSDAYRTCQVALFLGTVTYDNDFVDLLDVGFQLDRVIRTFADRYFAGDIAQAGDLENGPRRH